MIIYEMQNMLIKLRKRTWRGTKRKQERARRKRERQQEKEGDGERKRETRKYLHRARRVFKKPLRVRLGSGLWALYSAFRNNSNTH